MVEIPILYFFRSSSISLLTTGPLVIVSLTLVTVLKALKNSDASLRNLAISACAEEVADEEEVTAEGVAVKDDEDEDDVEVVDIEGVADEDDEEEDDVEVVDVEGVAYEGDEELSKEAFVLL